MPEIILHIIIIFSALGGLSLSFHIGSKKHKQHHLVCPFGHDCDSVVQSKYSKFLGIPVEIIGILYYATVATTYAVSLAFPGFLFFHVVYIVLALTAIAFAFSLYLTFIQAFILKQWCTWCLISAGFCAVIFIIARLIS